MWYLYFGSTGVYRRHDVLFSTVGSGYARAFPESQPPASVTLLGDRSTSKLS